MKNLLFISIFLSIGYLQEFRLYALNTQIQGGNQVSIVAIEDNTVLKRNGTIVESDLNSGEIYTGSISQYDIFSANNPIFGGTSNGGTVSLTPEALQGTATVVECILLRW